jgi:hypothetical protein
MRWLLMGALTIVVCLPPASGQGKRLNSGPVVGEQTLEIRGRDIDGKGFKLSDYRGKVVVLDFWGDW